MPLFFVKREILEVIANKQKTIELRRGKAKKGDIAVFQCVRKSLRRRIIKKEEGNLTDVLRQDNFKNIVPSAKTREEAINYIKNIYGTTEGVFTTYYF